MLPHKLDTICGRSLTLLTKCTGCRTRIGIITIQSNFSLLPSACELKCELVIKPVKFPLKHPGILDEHGGMYRCCLAGFCPNAVLCLHHPEAAKELTARSNTDTIGPPLLCCCDDVFCFFVFYRALCCSIAIFLLATDKNLHRCLCIDFLPREYFCVCSPIYLCVRSGNEAG